jgi:hypothetical protein
MDPFGTGSVYQHQETLTVAIRTELPNPRRWFVFDPVQGGHYAGTAFDDEVVGDGWKKLEPADG